MRILVLIDVSNLYYCIHKRFGKRLDYVKLLDLIRLRGHIVRAIAYGAAMGNQADKFISFLNKLGIETKYKEPQVYQNPGGENRKADWDVGIAMDAVRMMDLYDTIALVSADGDLCELIKFVHERGRKSIVIGAGVNWLLKDTAYECIEITPDLLDDGNHQALQEPVLASLAKERIV